MKIRNYHNQLRKEEMMKLCVGKEDFLASQPSMSRFETTRTVKELFRISYTLIDLFIRTEKKTPKEITIDIAPTNTERHGHQQGTLFYGFYMQYQYYPLLVFCKGICIGAFLRKGTAGANTYAYSIISRIVNRIRMHWPNVRIKVRGDCGFGNPKVFNICEKKDLEYIFGMGANEVLYKEVEWLSSQVEEDFRRTGEKRGYLLHFPIRQGAGEENELL